MGAWEPIIIQLHTSLVGGVDGQKEGKWKIKQSWKEKQGDLWWPEEYKTNGEELEL